MSCTKQVYQPLEYDFLWFRFLERIRWQVVHRLFYVKLVPNMCTVLVAAAGNLS